MEPVDPSKLIPNEIYYLENKSDPQMRGKGKFLRYEYGDERFGGTQAGFQIVPSENITSKKMKDYLGITRGFPLNSYKFYKALPQHVIDRVEEKDKEDRLTAFEKMINQQKLPMRSDALEDNNRAFIAGDQTFYGSDPDKSNLGTQLKSYGAQLLTKKTAGGRRRKSRKSRKSRKTKSRRRR